MRWAWAGFCTISLGLAGCLAPAPPPGLVAGAGPMATGDAQWGASPTGFGASPQAPGASPQASGASPQPSPSPTLAPGLLVPLYEKPTGPGWARLVAIKRAHPRLPIWAIANPDNGAPWGKAPAEQANWAALKAAGIGRLGYVSTRYGEREPDKVAADLLRWREQAPDLEGLFLDEWAAEAKHLPFCQAVVAQARALGFTTVVGNAGTRPKVAELAALLDVVVAYEKPGLPSAPPTEIPRDRQALLAYAVPSFRPEALRALGEGSRWLYLTELSEPNPWAGLSAHAEAMAQALSP